MGEFRSRYHACVSRRTVLGALATAVVAAGSRAVRSHAQASLTPRLWLPLVQAGTAIVVDDAPILGPASGTVEQATAWFAANANPDSSVGGYTPDDCATIVDAYQQQGDAVGIDWFLAMAQMSVETGGLTSWWSLRPQRNPAGLGVTGQVQAGTPDAPPGPGWAWHNNQWEAGLSFPAWTSDSVPAHLGRLLAYALTDAQANPAQRQLINQALAYRPLPLSYRGIAPTIDGLNGTWAVPGTTYGQTILLVAGRMRGG
ncbi:MAG: glucosaminidase domain-containing protein [Herpetosiphonaceae bacterium]|nr:glucosaminidase domain-containing protein [Herpetosiphonaceae bacterium]